MLVETRLRPLSSTVDPPAASRHEIRNVTVAKGELGSWGT